MNLLTGGFAVRDRSVPEAAAPQQADPCLRGRMVRLPGSNAGSCKRYMRERLAAALPEIADSLIQSATEGKLPELKILIEMSGLNNKELPPDPAKRGGKTLVEMLMEDWRKEPADANSYKG